MKIAEGAISSGHFFIGIVAISVANDVFSDIGVFLPADVADVIVDDRPQQCATLYLTVRRYQFGDPSVIEFEAEYAYPVFLFLRFFALSSFCSACRYFSPAFYGGDKIVVAAYVRIYFGTRHSYIFTDMGIRAGDGGNAAIFGQNSCPSVGFG